MIRFVSGDLLLSGARAIGHGVAPNDPFNQGLAHALRENHPAMYKDFRHFCHTQHPKEGSVWAWVGADGQRIFALFTQDAPSDHNAKPGRASSANINHALKALAAELRKEKITSLALPRLATGVGGMAWDDVKTLIEKHLSDLDAEVLVYEKYEPGVVANEKA